jgi:hypothetical protein
MTKKERIIIDCAAILSALTEEPTGTVVPASSIYIALGSDWDRYVAAAYALHGAGFAVVSASTIALTPSGAERAAMIEARLRAAGVDI